MNGITYEQPLNERIRTFLRLEFLFKQTNHTLYGVSPWDTRASIASVIDILNISSRVDLKSEVMMELERITANLSRLEKKPGVDGSKLGQILDEMDVLLDRLHSSQGQVAQKVRENEFINGIRQRAAVPGGTCDFDLPAYHHWLQQEPARRAHDLERWTAAFNDLQSAISLILRLVRDSAVWSSVTAVGGFYQQPLDTNTPFQLIRATLPPGSPCYAEISGGRHRFTIRLMEISTEVRPTQTGKDVEFLLACCPL